jgi:nucleoside-diphosphate-sugar epimerase
MTADLGRVLLTGSTGFIGRAIAMELRASGNVPFMPTRREVDLTDFDATRMLAIKGEFNIVFHFASKGVCAKSDDWDLIEHERRMAQAVLPVVKKGGVLVYAGSVSEYGHAGRLDEESVCTPRNAYGHAKLETGRWLRAAGAILGIKVRVVRIFGAYGPGEAGGRLFPTVVSGLIDGVPIELSDGQQIRDFVHVSDVAKACVAISRLDTAPDCINIGTGVGVRVRDVVERLCREMKADSKFLRFGFRARSIHDLDELVADTTRFRRYLGNSLPQRLELQDGILPLLR